MSESAAVLVARGATAPLAGALKPPGDKSVSHRALIFSTLAEGQSRIHGLLGSKDVEATANACRQLGAELREEGEAVVVEGLGAAGLSAPDGPLDMGNSGTAMRLLAGVLAAQPFDSVLIGDASLQSRPMRRIARPLAQMGAQIATTENGCAPLRITGGQALQGIHYQSPVASAQIKSCVLLAGLYASGETTVTEPSLSRDHTERMLQAYGVEMPGPTTVRGGSRLRATELRVPADISSAAFFAVGAALVPGSEVLLSGVGINPSRDGLVHALRLMGANVELADRRDWGAEPVADLVVRHGGVLKAIDLPTEWVPSMIDELPIMMVAMALAEGTSTIRGAAELRHKESDRIAVMEMGLRTLGFEVEGLDDGMIIHGRPSAIGAGGAPASVDGAGDHRCAMSFAILAQALGRELRISGASHIDTSYPGFVSDLVGLGGAVFAQGETSNA